MKGIELGAVDFLEMPISPLKLRNIWQHVVRKASDPLPDVRTLTDAELCGW